MKLFSKIRSLFSLKARKTVVAKKIDHTPKEGRSKNLKSRFLSAIAVLLLTLFCVAILAFSIRGLPGSPSAAELNQSIWKDDGPLELSPERGRYALLYAMTENKTFTFTPDIARFAAPDVAYTNGKYVSLFAPGVSYLIIPGYILGKSFGFAQIGAFAVVALFAICNVLLIRTIAIRLGARPLAASLAALAFLFASPSFAYAVTLYQHHISTFLILASLYLLIASRSLFALMAIWLMCGISITVDYPNFFMMLPLGVAALARSVVIEKTAQITRISLHFLRIFTVVAVVIPMIMFLWFNKVSYGSPFTLSGSVERAIEIKSNGQPVMESVILKKQLEEAGNKNVTIEEKNIGTFFHPRKLMDGIYTHFFSLDRGMIMYTPVMLFGFIGLFFLKRNKNVLALILGVIGFNVVLYSMWADPYGGWAFGSRYMIPTYAMLAISIGVLLTKWNKRILFIMLFFMMYSYSVGVNTLGAITSNRNPPQVEAAGLEQKSGIKQEYTYVRNLQLMDAGVSKSFVYKAYAAPYMSPRDYYTYLTLAIILVSAGILGFVTIAAVRTKEEVKPAEVKARIIQRRKGGQRAV